MRTSLEEELYHFVLTNLHNGFLEIKDGEVYVAADGQKVEEGFEYFREAFRPLSYKGVSDVFNAAMEEWNSYPLNQALL